MLGDVNLLAVLVAGIASMALGAFWYSPMGFGNLWMSLVGIDMKKMGSMKKEVDMKKTYAIAFVVTLVTGFVLALLVNLANMRTALGGALLGALLWLGFMGTTTFNEVLWMRKPVKLWLLNNAHLLLSMVVMGLILGAWA